MGMGVQANINLHVRCSGSKPVPSAMVKLVNICLSFLSAVKNKFQNEVLGTGCCYEIS